MSDCFYHTGRPSVIRCKQCSRPLCGECKIVKAQGVFCSEKCADTFNVFAQRMEKMEARETKKSGILSFVKVLIFLIILFFIFLILKKMFF